MDFSLEQTCEVKDIAFSKSTTFKEVTTCGFHLLVKVCKITSGTSIWRACSSSTREFKKTKTTTIGREEPSSSEESQRSIKDDSTIETKKSLNHEKPL